ncbi:MAG: hypothetical protein K8R54_04625 [Bacteroidales bacterium]|nr:hypothetical protein [Bacteroidales bacterium]
MKAIETKGIIDKSGNVKLTGDIDIKYINKSVRILILLPEDSQENNKEYSLTDLKGLEPDIWEDTDIEEYVKNERKWN